MNGDNMLEIDGGDEEHSKAFRCLNEIGLTLEPVERDMVE
jgi:hypothetical protein